MALLKTVTKRRFKLHDITRSAKFLKKKVLNGATSKRTLSAVNEWVFAYTLYTYTIGSVELPLHEFIYLITCTRNGLSDYLHLSGYLHTKLSI